MRSAYLTKILCGVALAALAQPALAQTTASSTGGAKAAVANDVESVAEIVVTANKRVERLQEVPVAVTVVGAQQVAQQNILNASDLVRSAPALTTQGGGNRAVLQIRGVGALTFSRTSEGSVGVVVDGVPLANASTGSPQLFDVARVEVLEGPQGTLFGRNSSAGIINITTNAPDPSKTEVIGHAQVGTRDSAAGQVAVNLPLTDEAALRVTGAYNRLPHTIFNIPNKSWDKQQAWNLRGRLKWTPTEAVTVNLIADYSKDTRSGGAGWAIYSSTPGSGLTTLLNQCGITPSRKNNRACIDGATGDFDKVYGFSGQVDVDLGAATLTSITAYRSLRNGGVGGDSDSAPVNILNVNSGTADIKNLSQEIRLASNGSQFIDYVLGGYYFHSVQEYSGVQSGMVLPTLPVVLGQTFATNASNLGYAAFGQGTIHFSDKFRGLVGLRYGREGVRANTQHALAPGALAPFGNVLPVSGRGKDNYFSYKLGLQYDVAHDVMAYGTYTRGYKGLALNDQGSPTIPFIVRPEVPRALEAGLKSTLMQGRVGVNVAVFHTKITDFQSQYFDPALLAYVYGNAPKLTIKGVSLNVFGRPVRDLSVNFGVLYNDATYGPGYLVACAQQQTAAQGCTPVTGPGGVVVGGVDDANGNKLIAAPKWKLSGAAEYTHDVTAQLEGFIQGDVVYATRMNNNQAYDPLNTTPPGAVVGGRIGVRANDQGWGVSAYVRNLFDNRRPSTTIAAPLAAQLGDPKAYAQLLGPESFRTFGVAVDFKW